MATDPTDVPVVIRPARPQDAAGLASVHTRSWREAYDGLLPADFLAYREVAVDTWRAWLAAPRTAVVVAEADDRVVGFATAGWADGDAGPGVGQLNAIYLLADRWGRGIGHRLHAAALDALAAHADRAVVWVLDANTRARAFYEREGWRVDGTDRTEVLGGVPQLELRMSRRLR